MDSVIVIPTYNEKENIVILLKKLLDLRRDFQIIVVDDNSSNGTGEILDKLAQEIDQLKVIHRPKKLGLGSAYIEGFKFALKGKGDYIFQMDADLSHDPKYLPKMLKTIEEVDLVIGSRYIKGGGIVNWSLLRRILSKLGNLYVRLITKIPIHDTTSGFKCFRRKVLESIDLDKISSKGYSFQIEMNCLVWKEGFRIREIPIIFHARNLSSSKLSGKIIIEAFRLVWKYRYKKSSL